MRRVLIVALLVLVVTGCAMSTITPRQPLTVPGNLRAADVELVILYGLADLTPPQLTGGERIADEALSAVLRNYHSVAAPHRWYVENFDEGMIQATRRSPPFVLRVAIRYDDRIITVSIVDSENLNQSATDINTLAYIWIDALEHSLRRALGQAAVMRRLERRY